MYNIKWYNINIIDTTILFLIVQSKYLYITVRYIINVCNSLQ